jgi:hypothetical protein
MALKEEHPLFRRQYVIPSKSILSLAIKNIHANYIGIKAATRKD